MNNNENNNLNPNDTSELSLDALEDVTGGGVREIVAATTLAAMAMTGNTASAFGLANALAEDAAHIEMAPAQEGLNAAYSYDMAEEIEIEAVDAEVPVSEAEAMLGDDEPEPEPEILDGGYIIYEDEADVTENPEGDEVPEGADAIEDEDDEANAMIDADVLEQIIRDTLDAHMGEGREAAIAAVKANLGDAVPAGLLTEALYKVLSERSGDEATPEDVLAMVKTPEADKAADEGDAADEDEADINDAIVNDEPAFIDDAIVGQQVGDDAINVDAGFVEAVDTEPQNVDALGIVPVEEVIPEAMEMEINFVTGEGEAEISADPEAALDLIGEEAEAFADPEAEAEARRALMGDLIETAVEAHRDEGIYTALDVSFATLAENSAILQNPETGEVETDGNRIINMTYDALAQNFSNNPEQLMGAIGAAAWRADQRGEIRLIGSDAALVSMAAAESNSSYADAMKYGKTSFDTILEAIALSCPDPTLKLIMPLLKTLGGDIFSTGGDPNAAVLKKLDAIEAQIQQSEAAIKRDTYNVVSLRSIGDKYSTVADKAELIADKIGNIMGNSALSDAQKLQQVADLLNNSEFAALESAMNGATKCFTSNVNDIFERQSIFEAAYARACESVMFSGEALKISTPYIARQLAVYLAAYGVMNQVYNAYEQVYGAGSLTATRQKMCERLGGVDLNGNNVGGSVGQQVKAYYGRDRYTFVNRGTANIQLRRGVLASHIVKDQWYDAHYHIDGWTQGIPLNAQQTEDLCGYAASRKESLFDYLFNDMGFVPVNSPSVDVERFFPEAHPDQWANVQGSTQSGGLRKKATAAMMTFYDRVNGKWQRPSGRVAMVDGKQTLASTLNHSNRNRYIKCSFLSATDVGVNKKDMESIFVDYDYKNKWIGYGNMDLLILQGR